jgi:hypothetical protein
MILNQGVTDVMLTGGCPFDTLPTVDNRERNNMLIQAITYIGAGVAFFVSAQITGVLIVMAFMGELPSKAKWDAATTDA